MQTCTNSLLLLIVSMNRVDKFVIVRVILVFCSVMNSFTTACCTMLHAKYNHCSVS